MNQRAYEQTSAHEVFGWLPKEDGLSLEGLLSQKTTFHRQTWAKVIERSDEELATAIVKYLDGVFDNYGVSKEGKKWLGLYLVPELEQVLENPRDLREVIMGFVEGFRVGALTKL